MKSLIFLSLLIYVRGYLVIAVSEGNANIYGLNSNTGVVQFVNPFPNYGAGSPLLSAAAYSPNVSKIWFINAADSGGPRFVYWNLTSGTYGTGAFLDVAIQGYAIVMGFWLDYNGDAYVYLLFGANTNSDLYKCTGIETDGGASTATLIWTRTGRPFRYIAYNYGTATVYANAINNYQLNATGYAIGPETNSTIAANGFFTYNRTGDILYFYNSAATNYIVNDLKTATDSSNAVTFPVTLSGLTFWDGSIGGTYTSGDITTAPSLSTGAVTTGHVTTGAITTSPVPWPTTNIVFATDGQTDLKISPLSNLPQTTIALPETFLDTFVYNRFYSLDEYFFISGIDQRLHSYNLQTTVNSVISINPFTLPTNAYINAIDNVGGYYALDRFTCTMYVTYDLFIPSFNLLWTNSSACPYFYMQFEPVTNDLYVGSSDGNIYHIDTFNGTVYGIISGWPTIGNETNLRLDFGFTFGETKQLIYTTGSNPNTGENSLVTIFRTFYTYEVTKTVVTDYWNTYYCITFYNSTIYGGYTTGITTGAITSGLITTNRLTTSPLTTSPLTTSPLTTSPLTSGQITTSPLTTSPLTTSPISTGSISTGSITSGIITTGGTSGQPNNTIVYMSLFPILGVIFIAGFMGLIVMISRGQPPIAIKKN